MLKKEGTACAKVLGVLEELGEGLCARAERVEGAVTGNELGRGHELGQILVFTLRAAGNL